MFVLVLFHLYFLVVHLHVCLFFSVIKVLNEASHPENWDWASTAEKELRNKVTKVE
jgi:hypothetical protein